MIFQIYHILSIFYISCIMCSCFFLITIHHSLDFNLGPLLLTVQYTENSLHNLLKCQSKSVPFKNLVKAIINRSHDSLWFSSHILAPHLDFDSALLPLAFFYSSNIPNMIVNRGYAITLPFGLKCFVVSYGWKFLTCQSLNDPLSGLF